MFTSWEHSELPKQAAPQKNTGAKNFIEKLCWWDYVEPIRFNNLVYIYIYISPMKVVRSNYCRLFFRVFLWKLELQGICWDVSQNLLVYPGERLGATFLNVFFLLVTGFFMQLASPSITQLSVSACFFGVYHLLYPELSRYLLPIGGFFDPYPLVRWIPGKSLSTSTVRLLHQACNGTWYWTRKAPSPRPLAGRRRVDFAENKSWPK